MSDSESDIAYNNDMTFINLLCNIHNFVFCKISFGTVKGSAEGALPETLTYRSTILGHKWEVAQEILWKTLVDKEGSTT